MHGTYDQLQVALSVLLAISASYAALDLAGRVTTATRARLAWLCGGAIAMGIGIWAMHDDALRLYSGIPGSRYTPRPSILRRAANGAVKSRTLEAKDHKCGTLAERQEIVDAIAGLDYWEAFTASGG
jgi:hypothetical protein